MSSGRWNKKIRYGYFGKMGAGEVVRGELKELNAYLPERTVNKQNLKCKNQDIVV